MEYVINRSGQTVLGAHQETGEMSAGMSERCVTGEQQSSPPGGTSAASPFGEPDATLELWPQTAPQGLLPHSGL